MSFNAPRYYPIGDYEYPSVTTVIAATTHKFWLGIWQRKQSVEYMKKQILDILLQSRPNSSSAPSRILLPSDIDLIAEEAIAYPDKIRDEAGERGARLHEQIDNYIKGETVELTTDIETPFNKFLHWKEAHHIGILFTEAQVWHDRYGYAGRVDWIHNIRKPHQRKNRIYITDFKISPRIYEDAKMQVAAYAYATQQTLNVNIDGAMIVALGHEKSPKTKELKKGELRHLQAIFLSKLRTYYLEKNWEGKK